jgi:hypothetical protein
MTQDDVKVKDWRPIKSLAAKAAVSHSCRTNVIQNHLSKEALEYFLHNILPQDSRFGGLMLMHSELWADNGDLLSKIYTGTGALKSDVTRSGKTSFAGMLGDATKSLNRFVINNFQDKDRQEVIDLLLVRLEF